MGIPQPIYKSTKLLKGHATRAPPQRESQGRVRTSSNALAPSPLHLAGPTRDKVGASSVYPPPSKSEPCQSVSGRPGAGSARTCTAGTRIDAARDRGGLLVGVWGSSSGPKPPAPAPATAPLARPGA